MSTHSLTNLSNKKFCQSKPKFNEVCSRDSLRKIKYGAYVMNLDDYKSVQTHWITLYLNGDKVTYFDSFGVDYIPK